MTGLEPIILEAAKSLTGLVLKTAWEMGNKPLDEPFKRLIFSASRQYIQNYEERHGNLKIVCVRMDAPVKLDEIYTAVQLLERSDVRYFESAETLQDLFRQSGRGFEFQGVTRQDGIAIANQYQYLMVLGGPGVGKSTFLRKVGLEALKRKKGAFQHECVPVFLKLQDFNSNEMTIEQLIIKEFETCGFPETKKFTEAALEKGNLLILLDGLDEVPKENLDYAIAQIQNLVDRYSRNRFIASCRIAAYKGGFQRFKDVAMAAFDDIQIEEFIRNWFRLEPETATQCWGLLKQSEYAAAKELAQTPLLLTLLCVVYDESQDFPKNRAVLYGEALDVLLKKWAAEKRLKRDPIYKELSPELEQILLSEIAHNSFTANQLFFSKRAVTSQIKEFLVNNLNAPKYLDGEAVLNAIEVQQGIFVERARDTYSFSHLTLQEYLTAQFIVNERQIDKLVVEHLTDQRWREIFLLVAGLMGRADELLEMIEGEAQKYVKFSNLQVLLTWADLATEGSKGNFIPAAKRASALHLLCSVPKHLALSYSFSYALVRSLDRSLDRHLRVFSSRSSHLAIFHSFQRFRDLANEFEKVKIFSKINLSALIYRLNEIWANAPDDNQPHQVRREFIKQIYHTWLNTLQLQHKWIDLSEKEASALAKYLYANELMVRCKESAVRVSRGKWEAIEERILKS